MLKTVVCDDERPALELAVAMLEETGEVEIAAACQCINEALEIINRGGIDLAVFDIDMPQISGVDAARAISVDPKPLLVFATAHAEYAVDAFDIDAIDYILKPIEQARVRHAVEKAVRLHRTIGHASDGDAISAPAPGTGSAPAHALQLRDGNRFYVVPLADIVWIEAGGDYSLIHTADSEIVVRRTLSSLAASLPPDRFLRVHRSYIIGRAHVREVRRLPKGEAEIHLVTDVTLRSGRSYREAVAGLIAG
jgi:two-component system, LytTR family, response regulator